MKKKTLALCAAMFLGFASEAVGQINDVTFTVSPTGGYTWWHKDLELGEAPFWGARAGFSFGPILEVRASYDRSFNLKKTLSGSSLSLLNSLAGNINNSYIATVERLGGELKANLWAGTILTPYLTAGAGILNVDRTVSSTTGGTTTSTTFEHEHLYGTLGAGLKINLGKRIALALEGKNTLINVDKGGSKKETLQNWGGQASLDFYLGGRQRSNDAISRAYRNMFTDGFRGIKFVFEPGIAYLDFNKSSLLHDQWLMGGSAGVDFSSLVGIRGFYYAATKNPQKLEFQFNDAMKLYGGNLIARLSQPSGVTPYLTLGAGYMDIKSNKYVDVKGAHNVKSGWFAMGGAGIEIPLHPVVALYGNVNAMLNEQENPKVGQVASASEVNVNMMYQAGVRFNVGAFSRNGEKLYKEYVQNARMQERSANMSALNDLRSEYEARISSLNEQLATAAARRDTVQIIALAEERARATKDIKRVDAKIAEEVAKQPTVAPSTPKTVAMTPAQLEEMIARVTTSAKTQQNERMPANTMSDLDKILLYSALANGQRMPALQQFAHPAVSGGCVVAAPAVETKAKTDSLLGKLEQIEQKINTTYEAVLRQRIEQAEREAKRMVLDQVGSKVVTAPVAVTSLVEEPAKDGVKVIQYTAPKEEAKADKSADVDVRVVTISEEGVDTKEYTLEPVKKSFVNFRDVKLFAGLGFGESTALNIGVRPEFQLGGSSFYLAPEAFLGFGSTTDFGLSANALYKFGSIKSSVSPYAGLGLGYNNIGGFSRFGLNTVVGVSLDRVFGGKLFVDYSLRPAFKNHQIAVGYQLSF